MSDVDLYIMKYDPEVRQRLSTIRLTALSVFREIDEKTYHGMPAIFSDGKIIMFYGAYKGHISICVGDDWVDFLKHQYPQFQYTRFTIKFLHEDPFPADVVQVICELLNQSNNGRVQHI